ncbi:MAG TPA: polyprenyl synthetase family protein [Actinomycetota bacterium]|nr:polyprenyl synthetase family protein [Actinomycetota bacterium]
MGTPSLDELRAEVDGELRRFLAARRAELPEANDLVAEIERLLDSGGKRIRPAFCYWGYRAAGGRHGPEAVRAAASLELLHTFAIVHDDIMDSSEERRGIPTVHVRHGVDVALLVGDLALVLADDLFLASGFPPVAAGRAFEWYSRMRQQVIAGQYLDLQLARHPVVSEASARRVAVLKSGRYTIEHPLAIGASLAGAAADLLTRVLAFGAPLGEAFQLRDDLLGIFGDRSATGKPVDSDIREGKRNVPFAKAIELLAEPGRASLVAGWGGGAALNDADVARLRALVEDSGARAATEALLEALTEESLAALTRLPIPPEARAALEELAHVATARST